MFRTLGARLTALAAGITLSVSLLVTTAQYLGIRHSLYHEVDAFLGGEITEFRAVLSAAGDNFEDAQNRIRAEVGSRHRGDLTFRLLNEKGEVLLTSDAQHRLPEPWPIPQRRPSQTLFRTESGSEIATHTRSASYWVDVNGSTYIVQATYLLDQVTVSLHRFIQISAIALAAATILAIVGGRLLANRSLKPVGEMAAAARIIRVENLKQRLNQTGFGDELDILATTFNEMFERLDKQVTQIRQFTADAAHELRTPLAALRGNAEVLLSKKRSAVELEAGIADSMNEFGRLARITDDLLLLARADAGQVFIRRANLRLDVAVADVVELFEPLAEERGVAISCSIGDPVWIEGDSDRLRQMIGIFVDNAIKYTPVGGRVDVSVATQRKAAEITIRDSGVGIAPEHLPHVFERFYRADRARSSEGGIGLGLAIARTIVQGHLGTVQLESVSGKGTTVRVVLPAIVGNI